MIPELPKNTISVQLLPNKGRGAFHGRTALGVDEPPEGYDVSYNAVVSDDGRSIRPALAPVLQAGIASRYPPVSVIPWYSSTTPIALILYWNRVVIAKNAGITPEADATTDEYGNTWALFDSAASTPEATLYTSVRSGSFDINRRSAAGSWTETTGTDAKALVRAGRDFYIAVNDYQVKKWNRSGNVYDIANYGSAENVGSVASSFRSAGAIGHRPVWAKTDGNIYAYNTDVGIYSPIYEAHPNPLHFGFMVPDGRGGLWTAHGDSPTLVHITRSGRVTPHYVLDGKTLSRDTPQGIFVAGQPNDGDMYFYMDRGWRLSQPEGMVVYQTRNIGATYTDHSADMVAQRDDLIMDISSMDTEANGDFILIGADQRFAAIDLRMASTNGTAARLKVARMAVGGSLFASPMDYHDGTDVTPDTASTPFGQSGSFAVRPDEIVIDDWTRQTVSVNGTDIEKYWIKLYLE